MTTAHTPPSATLTPAAFIAKWQRTQLTERAASHEHFLDLCRLLNQPTPAQHDATGAEYTFEKGTSPLRAEPPSRGFADVWFKNHFAWEYKRKDKYKSLDDAYRQLCLYREALDNPPLLIVSDIARIEIHTNFTGTRKEIHSIPLAELDQPKNLDLLRRIFTDPESLRPQLTRARITEDVAKRLGTLAQSLHRRGHDPHAAAHFLMKCMFCLFAEDVALLPTDLFKTLLSKCHRQSPPSPPSPSHRITVSPSHTSLLSSRLAVLFDAMRTGGHFGVDEIHFFNGGLFDAQPPIDLTEDEIGTLILAATADWSDVEPAIFGTLFERSLDPAKRSQIGAHYTSRDDIMLVVEPVIMAPLRRQWQTIQNQCEELIAQRRDLQRRAAKGQKKKHELKPETLTTRIETKLSDFTHHLASLRILDPACGSGNFLYIALQQLLDLEKQVITFAARPDIALGLFPSIRPTQLRGIEINPYAAELAQVVIWIGYLQWMRDNGFRAPANPILEPLQTIENRDAILDLSNPKKPRPAEWPEADFIIGNPPFLGSKMFRKWGLTDDYLTALFKTWDLPNTSDLCCYWFELARCAIKKKPETRAGLLATQGIRGGDNRTVLERIKDTGDIFMAWADKEWILDGAAVHVSIVGFDDGSETSRTRDGHHVVDIKSNLSDGADVVAASRLTENRGMAFMGITKGGAFDLSPDEARRMLGQPNPHGRSNLEVLAPWPNGLDVTRRPRGMWIIDFGTDTSHDAAASFDVPFRWLEEHVKPIRASNRRAAYAERWWLHVEPRPEMRSQLAPLPRFLVTARVTKHRIFTWMTSPSLPDCQIFAFARDDDYFFGVLHSSIHELWARRMGTQLREAESGFRYTPTTCFETFPLPWPPGHEPTDHPAYLAIAEAARALNEQRERWLNPPEWIDPIAARIDRADAFSDIPPEARPLIRQSAIQAAAAKDKNLSKRTLTNLYNQKPTWLRLAHQSLDRAVLTAYAVTDPTGPWNPDWTNTPPQNPGTDIPGFLPPEHEPTILARLLDLNQERA